MSNDIEIVRNRLIELLRENEILPPSVAESNLRGDLFDQGVMDSMGAVYLLELIEQEFDVTINVAFLVAELTSLELISAYIVKNGSVQSL